MFKRYKVKEHLPQVIEALDSIIENDPKVDTLAADYQNFAGYFSFEPERFEIPKYFNLCMVSTSSGSDTRVMVKNLMQWSKDNSDPDHENKDTIFSNSNWQSLFNLNLKIIEVFKDLK